MYLCPPTGMWLKIVIVFGKKGLPQKDVTSNTIIHTTSLKKLYRKFFSNFFPFLNILFVLLIISVLLVRLPGFLSGSNEMESHITSLDDFFPSESPKLDYIKRSNTIISSIKDSIHSLICIIIQNYKNISSINVSIESF